MLKAFIDDSYTVTTPVNVEGYETVTITYRPALPDVSSEWLATQRTDGKPRVDGTVVLLTGRLQSWDLKRKATDDAPLTCVEENWRRVPLPVLNELGSLVSGWAIPESEKGRKN